MKKILILATTVCIMQSAFAQIKIDRSKRPTPGPAPVITIKEGNKAGLLDLMGGMLGEGTKTMSKAEFDESVDMIGANVGLSYSGGNASALTRYFEKAFTLMGEGLKHPSFPQESFDKLKSQTITGLKANEKSAAAIAGRVSIALSYGKNTAMGEFTTEETVKALTLADVKEAYQNYITPSRSYLTFVGDITPVVAKALAEKVFGKWTGKKLELPVIADVSNPEKTEIDFVDLPTAVQGEMRVGNLVNNPMNGNDYHALLMATNKRNIEHAGWKDHCRRIGNGQSCLQWFFCTGYGNPRHSSYLCIQYSY